MNKTESITSELNHLPIHEYAFMNSTDVVFLEEVRNICKQNKCGKYGSSWACPPAVGSLEECKAQCTSYGYAFMFTTATQCKNRYDIKEWINAGKEHEKLTDQVADIFRYYDPNALVLSTEGCHLCKTCTYPDEPCKVPHRMYPATEGYGIMVVQQAKICNIKYNNGVDTVTYFSMVFYNSDQE